MNEIGIWFTIICGILHLILIYILSNTRDYHGNKVLRMWMLVLILITAPIPIVNVISIIIWAIVLLLNYSEDDWEYEEDKITKFLNKRV